MEILDPIDDRQRIADLRACPTISFVDGWTHAGPELAVLNRLDHVDPDTSAPEPVDIADDDLVERRSRYILFPWRSTLVRLPDADLYRRLKTARNRHLLTGREQQIWGDAVIVVAGLSVGSSALTAAALTGARRFRIADSDELAPTNLNRIVGSVTDLGVSKVELARRRILEGDPYTQITTFPDGYRPDLAEGFLGSAAFAGSTEELPASVIIEEIDDVAMKIDMRRRARAAGVPVLSATDMGENVVLDVERYDLDQAYPIFHGRGEGFSAGDAADPAQRLRMALAIVGDEVTPRMAFSASQLGRSVTSWPQLGSTAAMAGALVATAARNIVCGRPVRSGRYRFGIEEILLGSSAGAHEGWNELGQAEFASAAQAMGEGAGTS
ncbi:thiamine biosynthesis protein ThiF [Gordonia oryzae]|uniref:Thiamine biosynthesis protein ThiF n=1 Tax=Gordonia oryzae TaxID=2487349 RepID=A0A3N4H4B3_9ACTN|nr:ThiF family adenylyltransferase [Gordonia oryzae]RPA65660.1 thiamine biosynthesis protein ThiF [Gordonia oryzae]